MPSKHVVRNFSENSFYHVYNRGVEKRLIFLDEQDYKIFLYYLFIYLASPDEVLRAYPTLPLRLEAKNLNSEVDLLAYCLMPNHFHLLLKQNTRDGITKLLKQVTNAYTLYFNQKYKRVGSLLQGPFKAVGIVENNLLIHISRYIHLNPVVAGIVADPGEYRWSSHKSYLDGSEAFVKGELIISNFSSKNDYEKFVKNQIDYATELEKIKHVSLDGDDS